MTDTPGTLEFLMREGELLFVDNHKTLHARTPLANSARLRQADDPELGRTVRHDRGSCLNERPGYITHESQIPLDATQGRGDGHEVGPGDFARADHREDPPPARSRIWRAGCDSPSYAEEAGIESVLLSFSRYEPDTLMVACAVGRATRKLKFIVAYRSGLIQPTTFVQQVNTLSGLIEGRRGHEYRRGELRRRAARIRRFPRSR